jgi:hypothetical protein
MFVVQFIELHNYTFKCINLILYMLIWAMFDCRHKLDQIGVKYHKLEGAKEKKICAKLMFEKKKKNKAHKPKRPT